MSRPRFFLLIGLFAVEAAASWLSCASGIIQNTKLILTAPAPSQSAWGKLHMPWRGDVRAEGKRYQERARLTSALDVAWDRSDQEAAVAALDSIHLGRNRSYWYLFRSEAPDGFGERDWKRLTFAEKYYQTGWTLSHLTAPKARSPLSDEHALDRYRAALLGAEVDALNGEREARPEEKKSAAIIRRQMELAFLEFIKWESEFYRLQRENHAIETRSRRMIYRLLREELKEKKRHIHEAIQPVVDTLRPEELVTLARENPTMEVLSQLVALGEYDPKTLLSWVSRWPRQPIFILASEFVRGDRINGALEEGLRSPNRSELAMAVDSLFSLQMTFPQATDQRLKLLMLALVDRRTERPLMALTQVLRSMRDSHINQIRFHERFLNLIRANRSRNWLPYLGYIATRCDPRIQEEAFKLLAQQGYGLSREEIEQDFVDAIHPSQQGYFFRMQALVDSLASPQTVSTR